MNKLNRVHARNQEFLLGVGGWGGVGWGGGGWGGGGGGGGRGPTARKQSVFFFSPQLILQFTEGIQ